jgi:hypothetical protein
LLVQRCPDATPKISSSWPVRCTVDGTTVAQNNGRIHRLCRRFELALHVEDRSLGGSEGFAVGPARESTAKHDSGRFAQHVNVLAEMFADEFENGGLSCAGPASQHDALVSVLITTFAG